MMNKKLYLYVTDDRYELPLIVADSVPELSRITGKSINVIHSMISKYNKGKIKRSRFLSVELEE